MSHPKRQRESLEYLCLKKYRGSIFYEKGHKIYIWNAITFNYLLKNVVDLRTSGWRMRAAWFTLKTPSWLPTGPRPWRPSSSGAGTSGEPGASPRPQACQSLDSSSFRRKSTICYENHCGFFISGFHLEEIRVSFWDPEDIKIFRFCDFFFLW